MHPGDRAAFWVNHVIKHGGTYMKNPALELNFIQRNLIDVISFLLALVIVVLVVIFYLFRCAFWCCKRLCCKSKEKREWKYTLRWMMKWLLVNLGFLKYLFNWNIIILQFHNYISWSCTCIYMKLIYNSDVHLDALKACKIMKNWQTVYFTSKEKQGNVIYICNFIINYISCRSGKIPH